MPAARGWVDGEWLRLVFGAWNRAIAGLMVAAVVLGPGAGVAAAEDVDALLRRCAPSVHPETMRSVLAAESSGNVLAVADAGPVRLPWSERKAMVRSLYPASVAEAVALAKDLIARGHTVSLGLAQINDRNLARMGLTVEEVFEPCRNVAAGAAILTSFYEDAVKVHGQGTRALRAALSAYNSGSFVRGEAEGYVDLVYKQKDKPLVLKMPRANEVVVPALGRNEGAMRPAVAAGNIGTGRGAMTGGAKVVRVPARKDFTMVVRAFEEN